MAQRVGILGLMQESNTFLSESTRLEHFENDLLLEGDEIFARLGDTHHEIAGFRAGLEEAGLDAAPLFFTRAIPFGVVTADAYATLIERLFAALDRADSLDGLLVAPHGATVSAEHPDVDGHWLGELRKRVGPKMPIISTLDPHANLSPEMADSCDATLAYRSNPHLDQRARGLKAASLMARTLRGEVRPTQTALFPPLAINIECQRTAQPPCLPLYELADAQLEQPGVLDNSIVLGFPYADVAEMGSSVIAVTDDDRPLARKLAGELAGYMWSHREDFVGRLISIDDALDQAVVLDGPVCLLDMGDNVGGGGPGDSTLLARAMHARRCERAFVCLYDPESVQQADAAGVGAQVPLRAGGKSDGRHGAPLEDTFTVVSLHDGKFEESQPRHGGFAKFDQGRTAIVRSPSGLTLMLTSRRMVPFSIHQLTSCGLDPADFHLLIAKGVQAPVAAYEPVCKHLIRVNTPGATTADMLTLDYRHRRRPMFPFERDTKWDATEE